MKLKVSIPAFRGPYEVEIRYGALQWLPQYLPSLASRFAIITDDRIASLHGESLKQTLSTAGLRVDLFAFPNGENNKTRETKEKLENQLFEKGFGRDTCVIALGGGVVTDLVGFLAATYCRGVPLVIVPTSLMGMVDASIGGKTGVNVPFGKNMIGCLYQPNKTVIDPSLLKTLSKREFSSGTVEMIKHGLIADRDYFEFLEKSVKSLLALQPETVEKAISESIRIKKEIVEEDINDQGKRHLLNFGHTVGHALEKVSHFAFSHGEAVAIGILAESHLAMQMGLLKTMDFDRIQKILTKYELPLKMPKGFSIQTVFDALSADKKALKGKARFVLINGLGSPCTYEGTYCTTVDDAVVKSALQWMFDALR